MVPAPDVKQVIHIQQLMDQLNVCNVTFLIVNFALNLIFVPLAIVVILPRMDLAAHLALPIATFALMLAFALLAKLVISLLMEHVNHASWVIVSNALVLVTAQDALLDS